MLLVASMLVASIVLVAAVFLRRRPPALRGWARALLAGATDESSFTVAVRTAVRACTRRLDGSRTPRGDYVAPSSPLVVQFRSDVWEETIAPVREEAAAAVVDGVVELTGIDPAELTIRLCSAPLDEPADGPLVHLLTAGQVTASDIGGTVCPARPVDTARTVARFALRTVGSSHTVGRLPEGKVVTVGRAPGTSVRLTDPAVSAHHLTLVAGTDYVRLTDLGTTNGTVVNGHPVAGVAILRHGDRIAIGEHARWEVFDREHATAPAVDVRDPDVAPDPARDAPYDLDDEVTEREVASVEGFPAPPRGPTRSAEHRLASGSTAAPVAELRTQPMPWSERPTPRRATDQPVVVGTTQAGDPMALRALSDEVAALGNGHLLVVGTSGAGKTQLSRSLVAQAIRRGTTALVLDPAGEYEGAGLRSVNVWRHGVAANPLTPVAGADLDRTSFDLIEAMATGVAYGGGARLGHLQAEALRQALLDAYEAVGPSRWPVLQDVHDHLTDDLKGVLAPITGRRVFAAGPPLGDLIGENLSLNLADFPGAAGASRMAVGLTLAAVALRATTLPPAPGAVRHLVVLDEAHRTKGFAAVRSMLREGRRAGIGVVLVSQSLDDLPDIALAVAATSIVFRLGPEAAARAATHLGEPTLAGAITRLAPGQCFVHEAGSRPVRVDVAEVHAGALDLVGAAQ